MPANIRNYLKICAFAIALLSFVSPAKAAEYYVDYAAGSDSNAGDSTNAPWQHCPGDTALRASVDNTFVTASSYSTTGGSVAWNLTLATNITDGYIMVAVQGYYPATPASVTWQGTSLTYLGGSLSDGSTACVQFYGKPVGVVSSGTYSIGANLTSYGPGIFLGGAMLFQGVNQANPVGVVVATNSNAVSLAIPANGYAVVGLGTYNGNQDQSFGDKRIYNSSSGAKLTVATSTQTGNQTFTFGSSGYSEATLAVTLWLNSTSAAGSTQLAPNDTVHFKGGISYVLTGSSGLLVTMSGDKNAPIIYDGNSAGDWGTGKALITDNFGAKGRFAFHFAYGEGSNILIKNFDIGQMGGVQTLPADTGSVLPQNYAAGIIADVGFQNVTIADCYFHEIGYWQNVKPIANSSLGGHGILASGASGGQAYETRNLVITNCEFTKMRKPIQIQCFKDVQQVEIVGCYIHDYLEWAIDIAYVSDQAYFENIAVHDNRFIDYDKWYSSQFWTAYGEAPHQNGIYWRCDIVNLLTPSTTNINFYNNLFKATGQWSGGTTAVYLDGDNQANIYNNVFDNVQAANAAIQLQLFSSTNKTTKIYALIVNNTFYMTKVAISAGSAPPYYTDWPLSNRLYVTNNIFVNPLKNAGYQFIHLFNMDNFSSAVTNSLRFDYNSYETYNTSAPDLIALIQPGYSYLPFPGTKNFGWNTHSFTNHPIFVDVLGGDYHLQAGSPQIGAGVNLTGLNLPGLNQDKDGNPRPPLGPWTLGAYAPIGSSGFPYVSLVATPSTIKKGQSATLTWMSLNATNMSLSGVGQVGVDGSTTVSPAKNPATYVITATGPNGTISASVSVIVKPSAPVLLTPP